MIEKISNEYHAQQKFQVNFKVFKTKRTCVSNTFIRQIFSNRIII